MAGSPDHTKRTRMQGLDGTTLRTIAVDGDGQLYALLKGAHGGSYVPLQLDANGNIIAVIQGTDGSALRTVLTDVAGRLINVIRDPTTNNYVSVDSDGHLTTVMKGSDGAALQTVLVDASGRMVTVIQDPVSGENAKLDEDGYFLMKIIDARGGNVASVDGAGHLSTVMTGQYGEGYRVVRLDSMGRISAIMTGLYGESAITVGLDEHGYMIGVMKGDYEGDLKTLATDSDGRLKAIMTDPANIWGLRAVVGSGELAARLGSPVRYERRGTVYYINDCRLGLSRGELTSNGAGASAVLTADHSRTSGYAYKLSCGTAGGSYGQFEDVVSLSSYTGNIGLELHTTFTAGQTVLVFSVTVHDGEQVHLFALKWNMIDGALWYKNSSNEWAELLEGFFPYGYDSEFIPIKLVINLENSEYLRMYVGGDFFSLTGYSCYTAASGNNPSLGFAFSCNEDGDATSRTVTVCDFIVTLGEDAT